MIDSPVSLTTLSRMAVFDSDNEKITRQPLRPKARAAPIFRPSREREG